MITLMKKILLCLFLICAFISCSKDKKHCYECESGTTNPQYVDVGCFTNDEWDSYQPTDAFGNNISKNHCRKK
jgi:hypothetical protein